MNKINKIISILLTIIIFSTILPTSTFAAVAKPKTPTGLSASSTTSSITIKWKKVSGVKGYKVYSYNTSKKKYTLLKTTTSLSYKKGSLSAGKTYVYAVKSYKVVKGKTYTSSYSSKLTVSTKPKAPTSLKSASVTDSVATISWAKVTGASGYKIDYSTSNTFSTKVQKSTTSNTLKLSSLAASKKYYVRVYAYRIVNKITYTSAASSIINFTTKEKYYTTRSQVNEATTYQTIDGFGVSGAWWSQRIGRWTEDGNIPLDLQYESVWTQSQTENVMKYLYDNNEGIGLNVYRYNVGTDSYTQDNIWDKWKRTESFINTYDKDTGTITYDFSKDASAQNTLKSIKKFAGDDLRLTLFANSPPIQMTDNGNAFCTKTFDTDSGVDGEYATTAHQNLTEGQYQAYANYLAATADYFEGEGYNVIDISAVNEPQFYWVGGNQEGCHYTPKGLTGFLEVCADTDKSEDWYFSMFDCVKLDYNRKPFLLESYMNTVMLSDKVKNYYTDLTYHSYWTNAETKQSSVNYLNEDYPTIKKLRATEYCHMSTDTSNGLTELISTNPWTVSFKPIYDNDKKGLGIDFGIQFAKVINTDMTIVNATEYDWWTGVSDDYWGGTDALVYVNYKEPDNVTTSKRLWCMGNYSRFVKEGAKRVQVTEKQSSVISSAYKNVDGSLAIVYINDNDSNKTVNVMAGNYSTYSINVTDASRDLEETATGAYTSGLGVTLPAKSVVTVYLK